MPWPLRRAAWGTLEALGGASGIWAAVLPTPPGSVEVVLVHGLGCSHRYFRPLARELSARGLGVAAPDLPGFGLSAGAPSGKRFSVPDIADALADWLRASGRGGRPLVGNSFGAQVLVDLATRHPDLVGPLILIGPAPDRRSLTLPGQLARLARNSVREPPRAALLLVRDYLACGITRYLRVARAALAQPVEEQVRHLRVPVTVVRGRRDPVSSASWAAGLARRASASPGRRGAASGHVRYVEVAGAAHLAHWSAPCAVADLILGATRSAGDQGVAAPTTPRDTSRT